MSNDLSNKQNKEKIPNEDSSSPTDNSNISFTQNILEDINLLKLKEIYLISKHFEEKIPELLSYLQGDSNSTPNKLLILKYLQILFTKVNFNSEIFSHKLSNDKERLNLFQIIINQFINCPNDKDEYMRELKDLFILLLSQISLEKDTYHYIFSFLINYINKCNNNICLDEKNENNWNLTSEQLSRVLQLLQIYYQSMQNIDEPYNYFYFNGEEDSSITILNKINTKTNKTYLNLDDESLNILIFIKLIPSQIIKQVFPIINFKILDIFFNNQNNNISIDIDKDNYLTTNFTSEHLIKLKENTIFSLLIKLSLKNHLMTEIYINNEKVDIPEDIIIKEKDKNNSSKEDFEIKELKLFKNFIGICSNIMIYKESETDGNNEGLPKFFLVPKTVNRKTISEKFILKSIYLNGFYKEELFSVLLKQELKDKIDEKVLKELNMPIKDKSGENDIKSFLDNNLISIYMPNRIRLPDSQSNQSYKTANHIILIDSINFLDAEFSIKSPNLNGVHIHTKFTEDFNPFGGLNHFLPIIEIMTQNLELLFNENLLNFINLISSVFMPFYLTALENENNSNFFFNLSYFLEKIPDFYFDNQLACKLISISSFLVYLDKRYINLIIQFHNYILMNENIIFKFCYEDQSIILEKIKDFIDCSQREEFNIDIMLIINIILHYDKERYYKFCCKCHSDYFNESCDVLSPELNILLKPIEEIITKLFEKFIKEASLCLNKECQTGPQLFKIFELLTIDISPCLQKIIINQFFNYMKKHFGKYFALLDINHQMLDITLFIFKTSIFDVKIDALNLLFLMNKVQENMEAFNSNRSRTNSWAYNINSNLIDEEKSIFIENYILPFYLLGEGILVSSSSGNSSNIDNRNNSNSNLEKKEDTKNLKKYPTEKNVIKLSEKTKKLKKTTLYNTNIDKYNYMTYNDSNDINDFQLIQNERQYTYIKITSIQQKIYLNYKKKRMNELISSLYNGIILSFKEKLGYDFILGLLVKIVSKGDIILINKFLDELKKKSESKEILEHINNNQQLFHWLLETSFQAYMIKETNLDENKFKPGFCIDPIDEDSKDKKYILTEEEKRKKVDDIFNKTNEFIYKIIRNNIYKLDFVLTWSKYYYEIRNDKNNFEQVRNYVLDILINSYNIPDEIPEKNIIFDQKDSIYYLNMLFELLTFYKLNGAQNEILKELFQIDEELFRNFPHILLLEINNNENKLTDNGVMRSLNEKWKYFKIYEKIYSYFKPLWMVLIDKKKKEEKEKEFIHTFKKYIEKKNSFLHELELLFYSFNDIQEFKLPFLSQIYANKGIKAVFIIFHFFILLFNISGNETEIKNLYNDFRLFLTLLIIGSSTLIITSDVKKQKWPNESEYKEVQNTIQIILCYTFYFFMNKILEVDISIKKNNEIKKDESINKLNNYYIYIRQILIENLGYLLKMLTILYRENSGKIFSKMKNMFSNHEIIIKSGSYQLTDKLYSFIDVKDSNNNDNDNNNDNYTNFLDNILKINIKNDSKEINSQFEKNIYAFINSTKINNYISNNINDTKNKSNLYPFGQYIQKRENFIQNIIPFYNNRINSYEIQKHLHLTPGYWKECYYDKTLDFKIAKINKDLFRGIFINQIKNNLEKNAKMNEYKKIKKKLFSFRGIWSKEEFFYESKYHLKYKLVNHLTEDYSKVMLTPILDLDYYLPIFSKFQNEDLFRKPENQIPIYYLADLSFVLMQSHKSFINKANPEEKIINDKQNKENEKENKIKEDSNELGKSEIKLKKTWKKRLNALFDVKNANYSFNNTSNSNSSLEQILNNSFLLSEFINHKHSLNSTRYSIQVNACLVKTAFHICGVFYSNSHEIGFYSSRRTLSNEDEDYDYDRKVCFGSIFKSQTNKYNYYYLRIPFSSIEFILKRRYYFKKSALEIYTINKKSYFFKFQENQMKTIFDNIRHYMKLDIEDISIEYTKYEEKIGFYNKNKKLNNVIQMPNTIKNMNLRYMYEKWQKWEISTLKLLMILNIYANRSYNDINQYPVFPWIITDYSSKILPSVIPVRQMGVPMGMMDITEEAKERKEAYLTTWGLNEKEEGKELDYDRYRSHYSTSLYVTYYLVRVFPFSYIRIELQGNSFDDPNRLFNSIENSFYCALTQQSDIREILPEMFFFPEMFYNLNKLNLGDISNRETDEEIPVNNTEIPDWANNDGYLFVNKHRMLLESPEINEKINEWFNIIFGNKQNGKDAKKIGNLFINQTYESFYEVYNKSEPKDKIYFCRMVEFGVTPHQIFKYEANKRFNYNELKFKKNLFSNITEIIKKNEEKQLDIIKEIDINEDNNNIYNVANNIPVKIFLYQNSEEEKLLYILNDEGVIRIIRDDQQQNNSYNIRKLISSQNLDFYSNKNEEKDNMDKKVLKKMQKFANSKKEINLLLPRYRINIKNIPNIFFNKGNCIALGGFWNGNILIEKISSLIINDKNEKKDYPETKIYSTNEFSPIIHMIIDINEFFVICGNILGTIFIYTINQVDKTDWNLYKTIYDHFSPITSISINEKLNIFATCSKSGYCMIYTLPNCKLVNSYKLQNIIDNNNNFNSNENLTLYAYISLISSSPLPCIIFYFKLKNSLAVLSINGHFICEKIIDFDINTNEIKIFNDNQFIDYLLIYNKKNDSINIFNIIDLNIIMTFPIKNYSFIDFIFCKDLDSIYALANDKISYEEKEDDEKNYKILVLKYVSTGKQQFDLDENKITEKKDNIIYQEI